MKPDIKQLLALVVATFAMGSATHNISALEVNRNSLSQTELQQSYTWYDGTVARTIWLNPRVLAEFSPQATSEKQIVKSIAGAKAVANQPGNVTIWQADDTIPTTQLMSAFKTKTPSGQFSAVWHDNATSQSRLRALPGNIIVFLNPQWDQARVSQWLSDNKLSALKQLTIGTNVFLIETPAGLESLNKANALYESGQVVAAFPNWWQEYRPR